MRFTAASLLVLALSYMPAGTPFAEISFAGDKEAARSAPTEILLIRHAEKPDDEEDPNLTSRGSARAAALPSLFVAPPTFPTKPARLPTPDFVIATHASKHSDRPVQTVKQVASALGTKVHHHYDNDKHAELATEILTDNKYRGRTVLICWHHGTLPALARELIARSPNQRAVAQTIPDRVPGATFDRIWRIRFDKAGNATFANEPQKLLFGDSAD